MKKKRRAEFIARFWTDMPNVPHGWRCLAIDRIGPKWVTFTLTEQPVLERHRVPRKVFDALALHVLKRGQKTGDIVFTADHQSRKGEPHAIANDSLGLDRQIPLAHASRRARPA